MNVFDKKITKEVYAPKREEVKVARENYIRDPFIICRHAYL